MEGLIFGILRYFRVFKEYPQKSQIWQSETSPNQGIPNQVPWLGHVSLFQIWDFCWYSLNTLGLKYPKMGICFFFPVIKLYPKMDNYTFLGTAYLPVL